MPPESYAYAGILSDFNVGGLAFGDADGRFTAPVLATSGDALVRPVDGVVYVVERGTVDAVSAVDPVEPDAPVWQVALPQGCNAHDLVGFAERLWVPCHGTGDVLVLDPAEGEVVQTVPLAHLAEGADGNPELDAAVVAGDHLYVAAQRLYDDPEVPGVLLESDGGLLVELDAAGAVVQAHEVGPNPRISRVEGGIAVLSGLFVFPGASESRATDGDLRIFDAEQGVLGPAVLEETGDDLFSAIDAGERLVVLTVDADSNSEVKCVDLRTGDVRRWSARAGWFITSAHRPIEGSTIVGIRRPPEGGFETGVAAVFDPVACMPLGDAPTCTTLEPYDFAAL
ncbi:MAG: hypothetical protein R3F61_10790 [Myxococcota bacterium]